jgi:transcriptional regulator with XRE-family HTH domain
MGLLSQAELNPLQEARRCAETHMEEIKQIALARVTSLPRGNDDPDVDRYHRIAEVFTALQTILDNVSELEFEEEPEPEPELPPEASQEDEEEPDEEDDDEDGDEEEDE